MSKARYSYLKGIQEGWEILFEATVGKEAYIRRVVAYEASKNFSELAAEAQNARRYTDAANLTALEDHWYRILVSLSAQVGG